MKRLMLIGLFPCLVWAGVNANDFQSTLHGIKAGEKNWLAKVPELSATADVKQAIELEDALAFALSVNTDDVLEALRVIDAKSWPYMIGTDIVCGVPSEQTAAVVEDFYQRTRMALLSTDKAARCLWFLEATYEEWKADNARKVK